jgi:protein-S-isoprenylcysteine O-methyltransferase Ste14
MQLLATIALLVFLVLAFGLRTFLQWRATGGTGFVGLRQGAGPLERAAGAAVVLALALGPLAPWFGEPLWARGHAVGGILALVGIGLTFLAQLQMGASWRIGVDTSERTELVTTGTFAAVRNPIFSAMLLVSVGLALAAPTPLALALLPLLVLALEVQVRLVEEPYLIRVHGPRYLDWASRTGRFVPWFGRLTTPVRTQ